MTLYAQVREGKIQQLSWAVSRSQDWYELAREPDPLIETLRYDLGTDSVLIEERTKTPEQILDEQKAAEDAALMKPDTIRDLQARLAELENRLKV